jgi:hypothetical protein
MQNTQVHEYHYHQHEALIHCTHTLPNPYSLLIHIWISMTIIACYPSSPPTLSCTFSGSSWQDLKLCRLVCWDFRKILDTEPYAWSLKPFTLLPVHSSPKLFTIDHTFVITSLKGIFQRLYTQMSLLGMFATEDVPTKGLKIRVKPLCRNISPGTHVAYL